MLGYVHRGHEPALYEKSVISVTSVIFMRIYCFGIIDEFDDHPQIP